MDQLKSLIRKKKKRIPSHLINYLFNVIFNKMFLYLNFSFIVVSLFVVFKRILKCFNC